MHSIALRSRAALRSVRLTSSSQRTRQMSMMAGPVEISMRKKLTVKFNPLVLNITNDSSQHRHHAAMRAQGGGSGETHFSIEIVSPEFKGLRSLQRHRLVHSELAEEFKQGLHALSLVTKTPEEAAPTSL